MKVYIVIGHDNESGILDSVYSNKKLAELKAEQLNKEQKSTLYWSVEEMDLIEWNVASVENKYNKSHSLSYVISKTLRARILNSIDYKLESNPQIARNQYLLKMQEQNEVLCSKCYKVLAIGERYQRNQKTGRTVIHYFCLDCDRKRYHWWLMGKLEL